MRILLLHQFFVLDSEPGGTRHIFLSRFFRKAGAEVRVIAGSVNYMTGKSKLPFYRLWKNETVDGIHVTWVYCFPTFRYGTTGKFICYCSFFFFSLPVALFQKADVVLATTPPPTAALLGWLAAKLKRIPWILEVRDLWPEMILDSRISFGAGARLLDRSLKFFYRSAASLVSLTSDMERRLIEKGIAPHKICTITNGVDPIFLNNEECVAPSLPFQKKEKFWVMHLGCMGVANDPTPLLAVVDIFRSDERVEFVFVGGGSEKEKFLARVNKIGLPNVKFVEPVPRRLVPSLLGMADACILTYSRVLALPNRIFDYLASGKPVIYCSRAGEASEMLEKSGGGVRVDPGDVQNIRKWILHFLEHPDEAAKMGKSGREYVMRNFLREDLAKRYFQIMKDLV